MQNQKGFIQKPFLIVIIAGVLVFGGGGYFGVNQYQNYQTKKAEQKKITQAATEDQQKALEQAQTEIEKLKEESTKAQERQSALEQKIITEKQQKIENDLSSIIQEWRPRISYIECDLHGYGLRSGESITRTGSGTIFKGADGTVRFLTNKHVLDEDDYLVNTCRITFPNSIKVFVASFENKDIRWASTVSGEDWGYLTITPDAYIKNLALAPLIACFEKPSIGDAVLILGYPSIGSQTDITATEGIISGYDGDYYITSAKVDRGNSGGAAILVKESCHLGIPTFTKIGSAESLARILDLHVAIEF